MTTETTWDGLPIATGSPQGSSIIVRRPTHTGWRYLVLHRATHGPDHHGHWAWTPPAGMRQPGEAAHTAAVRELAEETGITAATIHPVDLARGHALWTATVDDDTVIVLDHEHDRFEWLNATDAAKRCRPALVAEGFTTVDTLDDPAITLTPHRHHQDITVDGKVRGRTSHQPAHHNPELHDLTGDTDAVAITCRLTDPNPTDNLIPRLAWQLLRDIVIPAHPKLTNVWIALDADDPNAIATWGKAGFTHDITTVEPDRRRAWCVLRVRRWLS